VAVPTTATATKFTTLLRKKNATVRRATSRVVIVDSG
jgi:hypothetical protein